MVVFELLVFSVQRVVLLLKIAVHAHHLLQRLDQLGFLLQGTA